MRFTDIFIRRPVLATVLSLLILVLGLRAMFTLQVLQYPKTENAVVTVTTTYYGADPATIAGFITTPLENAIAQADGIDYMSSTSTPGVSTISVYLRLNYDASKALTQISSKISSVINQLPPGTQQPVLSVKVGQTIDAMYIGFNSERAEAEPDHRLHHPRRAAEAAGGARRADRRDCWAAGPSRCAPGSNPAKLAAYGLTATDVAAGTGGERLHLRPGHHQGADGAGGPDRLHRPALAGRVPQPGGEAVRQRHRAAEGRGARSRWATTTTIRRSASTASARCISASRWRPRPTC